MSPNPKNIFVIRLPLTYLNAVEAQSSFTITPQDSVLIILYRDIEYVDIKHIKKLLNYDLWNKVHFLPYNVPALCKESRSSKNCSAPVSRLKRTFKIREFISAYNKVLQCYNDVERVFIGDYHIVSMRHIVNSLAPKQTILLDEGFNVYRVFNKLKTETETSSLYTILSSVKHRLFDLIFGYKMYSLHDLCFFTSYQLKQTPHIKVIPNTYPVIRQKITLKEKTDTIYFLGQCFSEIGAMSEEDYLTYLTKISSWFAPRKMIYIPHRGDVKTKLARIKEIPGVTISNLDMPIEFHLSLPECKLPYAIAGFNTSALQNIKSIFESTLPVFSFVIEQKHLVPEKREMFRNYYSYLKTLTSETFSVIKLT